MEGTWHWRCQTAEAQGEWEDAVGHETGQDIEGLRKSLRLVLSRYTKRQEADRNLVTPDMKLSPNVGSDRSWVWNVAADVSEGEPEAQTLAIRFANSESEFDLIPYHFRTMLTLGTDANLFKEAFIKAQQDNEKLFGQE